MLYSFVQLSAWRLTEAFTRSCFGATTHGSELPPKAVFVPTTAGLSELAAVHSTEEESGDTDGNPQGTITHMAPEIMAGGRATRSSDMYAFGILLWELWSGAPLPCPRPCPSLLTPGGRSKSWRAQAGGDAMTNFFYHPVVGDFLGAPRR